MIFIVLPIIILVLIVSFWLAKISMRDYRETAQNLKKEYGVYLVRNSSALTVNFLQQLQAVIAPTDDVFSIERLLKGRESALVVFGPKTLFAQFAPLLNLIELEDFTVSVDQSKLSFAEIGFKATTQLSGAVELRSVFGEFEPLADQEQVWVQIAMKADKKSANFKAAVRIGVLANDQLRRKKIIESFIKVPLLKIPRPYSVERMAKFYRERTISLDEYLLSLSAPGVLKLVSLEKV